MGTKFELLCTASKGKGERNDCAVKAVALVCDVDYATAHATLKTWGRRSRCGTFKPITFAAIKALGFSDRVMTVPAAAKTTTTLPAAMKRAGMGTGRFLVFTASHVLAFVDGRVEDWTKGRNHRIKNIYRILPAVGRIHTPNAKPTPAPKPAARRGLPTKKTRYYWAAKIIKHAGLGKPVSDAMVAELNMLYGKQNDVESRIALNNTRQALAAYTADAEPQGEWVMPSGPNH